MLTTIDIGHNNFALDKAMSVLEAEVSNLIFQGKSRAIKIIHGHGSGALKNAVREWSKEQQGRFKAVIFGENYDMFDKESMKCVLIVDYLMIKILAEEIAQLLIFGYDK